MSHCPSSVARVATARVGKVVERGVVLFEDGARHDEAEMQKTKRQPVIQSPARRMLFPTILPPHKNDFVVIPPVPA